MICSRRFPDRCASIPIWLSKLRLALGKPRAFLRPCSRLFEGRFWFLNLDVWRRGLPHAALLRNLVSAWATPSGIKFALKKWQDRERGFAF